MSAERILPRRCGCRDPATGKPYRVGACPKLASSRHGQWGFALERPAVGGRRRPEVHYAFRTRAEAVAALAEAVARQRGGITADRRETVGEYLTGYAAGHGRKWKPTTAAIYAAYLRNDLRPALGAVPLEQLRPRDVERLVADLTAAGRGAVTIRRIHTLLSSALNHAVRQRRLAHNPALHASLPEVARVERGGDVATAVAFLAYVAEVDDRHAELFEFLIGTGMRKGEALALQWSDVDLSGRVCHVRRTLSVVAGSALIFTEPKTKGSMAGVGLSRRVVAALQRQRARQDADRARAGADWRDGDLVFANERGGPLRPERVLRRFKALAADAGLPPVRVHDLRHLAASMMLAAGVPLAAVSKTLRHSTVAITGDIYSHLSRQVAHAAVDAAAALLDAAEAEAAAMARAQAALGAPAEPAPDPESSPRSTPARTYRAHRTSGGIP